MDFISTRIGCYVEMTALHKKMSFYLSRKMI